MFKNTKIKRMFADDDPKLVIYLDAKKINLSEIFKDDEDIIEKSIKQEKNTIAEAAIMHCTDINRVNKQNQTYLMLAILHDNLAIFHKLLEAGINVDIVDNNRESALFYALRNANQEYFEALIENDIDIKGYNLKGENALICAYVNNRKDICLYFLDNNIYVNHLDKDGDTILHYALKKEDTDFAVLLIDYNADVFIKNYRQIMPLDIAREMNVETVIINKIMEKIAKEFENENNEYLLELLDEYDDVTDYHNFNLPFLIAVLSVKYNNKTIFDRILRKQELLNNVDYRGKSLLMYCVELGMFVNARKILYLDSDLNLKDKEHKTILYTIVEQLNTTEVEVPQEEYELLFKELLERKVDINCQDREGNTVLIEAIINKQTEIADKLINYPYVDLNITNNEGKSALMVAYEMNDFTSLNKMIHSNKAEINAMDINQNTLMLQSLKDDNFELFSLLLSHGADLNLQYQDGMTLLMIALNLAKKRFIAKIFEYPDFNVDIQDNNGLTALMHAINNNDIKVVAALIKCGADVNIEDNKGDSAIFYALEIENFEIAKLIRDYSGN
jgi:ankyrin repeat protein